MSRTERTHLRYSEDTGTITLNPNGRDDKACRTCCGNGWQKAENKRDRKRARREIQEHLDGED